MTRILSIGLILVFGRCDEAITSGDLLKLNGYWEIEEVVFPDANRRVYEKNDFIAYFQYGDREGFRKIVQPSGNDTYLTSDDALFFKIAEEGDTFFLEYEKEGNRWRERIAGISANDMVLVNENDVRFHYIRYNHISQE